MGAKKHVHKYGRIIGDVIWRCALPNCTHYMPTNMPAPVGKHSICWGCQEPFELTHDNMKSHQPTCDACTVGTPEGFGSIIDQIMRKSKERKDNPTTPEEEDKPESEDIPLKD